MEIWDKIIKKYKLQSDREIVNWIACDPKFVPGQYDLRFKQWAEKGITAFYTIFKDGICMSFQELKGKFGLEKRNFFRCLYISRLFFETG